MAVVTLVWFGLVWWTPSILEIQNVGRKVGIPRGILPHIQTGLTIGNPDLPVLSRIRNLYHAWEREGSYGQFFPNTT